MNFKRRAKNVIYSLAGPRRLDYVASLVDSIRCEKQYNSTLSLIDKSHYQHLNADSEYLRLYADALSRAGNIESDNISKQLRYFNLYSVVNSILDRGISGDFAECGCWHGHSVFLTCSHLNRLKRPKNIHVFDSFEGGLSEFKNQDLNNIRLTGMTPEELSATFSSSFEILNNKCKDLSPCQVTLNKGWIPQIFDNYPEKKYAFVHVDVDLYEPTMASFQYFFPRLNAGGVIVCDDYSYSLFPGAKKAVDEFISSVTDKCVFHSFAVGGCMIIKN